MSDPIGDFGMLFNVEGNMPDALQTIASRLKTVNRELDKAGRSSTAPGNGFIKFSKDAKQGSVTIANAMANMNTSLQTSLGHIQALQGAVKQILFDTAVNGIKTAADVEESDARLRFGLRKINRDFDEVAAKIDEISLKTVLSRKEISDLTSSFGVQGIDVFTEKAEKLSFVAADGATKTMTSLEALNDAVAFSGKNVDRIMMSVKEAVSEQKLKTGRWLADDLNLSKKELEKWNKELAKAKTNQEAFETTMRLIAERVGGSTDSVAGTLNFVLKQIDDWVDKINSEMFKGALPFIRDLIQDIGDRLLKLVKDGTFQKLGATITGLFQKFTAAAGFALGIVEKLIVWLADNPWALEMVAYIAAFVAGLATVLTLMGAVVGVVMAVQSIIALWPIAVAGLKTAFLFLLPILAKVVLFGALIGGALALIARIMVGGKDWLETWERVKLVFSAIWEGIQNMTDDSTTLSEKTARALENAGLLDFVWNVLRVIHRVKAMFMAVVDTVRQYWPLIQEIGTSIMNSLSKSIENIRAAFGLTSNEAVKGMTGAADSSVASWVEAGITIGEILAGIIIFVAKIVEWIAIAIEKVTALISKFTEIGDAIGEWGGDLMLKLLSPEGYGPENDRRTREKIDREAPAFVGEVAPEDRTHAVMPEMIQAQEAQMVADAMAKLGEYQKQELSQLMQDRDQANAIGQGQSKENYDRMAQLVGRAVADALAKHPPEVVLDGEKLTDKLAARAMQRREESS